MFDEGLLDEDGWPPLPEGVGEEPELSDSGEADLFLRRRLVLWLQHRVLRHTVDCVYVSVQPPSRQPTQSEPAGRTIQAELIVSNHLVLS